MKRDTIVLLFLVVAIIAISLWFSTTSVYVPYSSTLFSQQAKYEGFLNYSSTATGAVGEDVFSAYSIAPSQDGLVKVAGFSKNGVFGSLESTDTQLDMYSQAKGDLSCLGSGYHNSKGALCMTDDMKKMLSTRGLNASGPASVVAGSKV